MGNWGRKVTRSSRAQKVESLVDSPGYAAAVRAVLKRANQWIAEHGWDGLSFTLPPTDVGIIAAPHRKIIELLAPTETGREFLRALDEASGRKTTVLQLCATVRALGLPVEDWSESQLAELMKQQGDPS